MNHIILSKRVVFLLGLQAAFCVGASAVELSTLTSLPTEDVNISVASPSSNGLTARYYSADNQRSLTQTFIWNSDMDMSGLGVLISSTQNSTSGQYFTKNQDYYLDIQQLVSATGDRSTVSTIATLSFTITTSVVVAGQYLYIAFDAPLNLQNGSAYGFNLRPAEMVDQNALSLDRSSVLYDGGVGNQTGSVSPIGIGSPYGNASLDLVFFTTTTVIPETSTSAVMIGLAGCAALVLSRRRRVRNK